MSLVTEISSFQNQSVLLYNHKRNLSGLSMNSTDSGEDSIGVLSIGQSLQRGELEDKVAVQSSKIHSLQEELPSESNALSGRQVEDQTSNEAAKDPMQMMMDQLTRQMEERLREEMEKKLKEQEKKLKAEQEEQRLIEEQRRQAEKAEQEEQRLIEEQRRHEQDAIMQRLLSENEDLKKKVTQTDLELTILENNAIQKLKNARKELQDYKTRTKF